MSRAPIIVDARGDVSAFDSVEAAEVALEPIDVSNKEYKVFDAEGTLLEPRVTSNGLRVRLVDSSPPERQPDELAVVLRRFLSRMGAEKTGLAEDEVWRAPLPTLLASMQVLEQHDRHRRRFR